MEKISKILIAPSILSGDFANMGKSVRQIKEWGGDIVHCDVMDGVYVKNLTFGMPMIAAIKKVSELPLDVHLMITEPERYVEEFIASGADFLTFHPDASKKPLETLKSIRSKGVKAGIVFNPDVPFEPYKELIQECDIVLVMSVFAGKGGQKFIEESLGKVRLVREYIESNGLNAVIEIDGGINEETAKRAVAAGVRILVAGSAVFKAEKPEEIIKKMREER
jgi:ribulose-phosphate 3-epimerase